MRRMRSFRPAMLAMSVVLALMLAGCASGPKRPVFYPNDHMKTVGKSQSEQDAEACMALALDSGVSENRDGEVGKKAAKGAVVGGIASGVWGLFRGDAGERAVAGAAAGAATGAVGGAFQSAELNPTFKRFVQRCLSERGYEVIGWE